jgi:hypothetical protein
MPAGLPGDTAANNTGGNPDAGRFVIFDPLSGPNGSPFDTDPVGKASTGALQTGIGFSSQIIGPTPQAAAGPASILAAGFNDNGIPGEVPTFAAPPPNGVVASNAINSTRMYIGGGRTSATGATYGRPFPPAPYTAGIAICGAGQGLARDGGAGPAFTGFPLKMVTATGTVANGAAIETGFVNRSGGNIVSGQSAHGNSTAELAVAS